MKRVLLLGSMLLLAGRAVPAHHSIAGVYDSSNPISFEAVVVDFQFVNPHPFVVVDRI